MSQELRVVPAALLEHAVKTLSGLAPGRFTIETELRAIVDAPVPHAFGEPWEILAWLVKDARDGQFSAHRHDPTGWGHGYQVTELTDRAHVTRLQAENAALQQRLNIADQRVDELQSESFEALYNAVIDERDAAQSELAKAGELLKELRWSIDCEMTAQLMAKVDGLLAHQSAPAAAPLDHVHGDVLPPIGSTVQIQLGDSGWFDHTVTGYYAWPNHGLDKNVHRVFVRVKDSSGTPNARLLADIRLPTASAQQ